MNLAPTMRHAAAAGLLILVGGCASGAWRFADDDANLADDAFPIALPEHRAVERVTLNVRGHDLEFVGYRSCRPYVRDVRVQLLLDSGISALDVAVHDERNQRFSGSAFEAIPRFADIAMEDLRRTWGSRSVFRGECDADMFGSTEIRFPCSRRITDGHETLLADALDDRTWLAARPHVVGSRDPVHAVLLDADLVPEATIEYSDFDEDGVPREIHLVDLRDGHTVDVEVEEVRVVGAKASAAPAK